MAERQAKYTKEYYVSILTINLGPIEKGANDGQLQYAKDLVVALRGAVNVKEKLKNGLKGKSKGGKKKKDSADVSFVQGNADVAAESKAKETDWGLLEPVRSLFGLVTSLVSPSVIIAVLSFAVFIMWWRQPTRAAGGLGYHGLPAPHRIAAYEEMWRTEESELWKWLEERVGLDGAAPAFLSPSEQDRKGRLSKQRVKEMDQRLVNEDMSERQMMEAIQVTKERLEALEEAVKQKHKKPEKPVKDSPPGGQQAPLQEPT